MRLHRDARKYCDYTCEIVIRLRGGGDEWKYSDSHARLLHSMIRLSGLGNDNRKSKPMHSDLLRKVEAGAAGVETCVLPLIKKSLMSQVN